MRVKYIVRLRAEEREELTSLVKKGKSAAYKIKHANILLKTDADGPNWTDSQVAEAFNCHFNTVVNVRKRFVEGGLQRALSRKKQQSPSIEKILDGEKEARLLALSCSSPPEGRKKWTLSLLAQRLAALEIVDNISPQTVMRSLKKMK